MPKYKFIDNLRFYAARKFSHLLLYHRFKGAGYLRNKLCHWLVPPANGPTVCPTLFNIDVLVDPVLDRGLERFIYYFGEYEAGTLSVLRNFLATGDVFLDVGANIGFLSCAAAHFVGESGHVYAVEPHPETYRILESNIARNKSKNISAFNIALGVEVSEARIYDNLDESRGSASLIRPKDGSEEAGKKVKVTTVDALLKVGQICPPSLMKVDVEGFELEVLLGAKALLSSSEAPALCVEFSNLHPQYKERSARDLYEFISSVNNYAFFKLKYGKGIPSELIMISEEEQLPRHDNVFCFLNRHLKAGQGEKV